MMHFCTYFDINYLHRGLALYRSLKKNAESFTLWILCFDNETYEVLSTLKLANANLIRQQEFEAGDQGLVAAKKNRSKVEYYWTSTPSLPLYIFKQYPETKMLTYLDADIYFFSSPDRIIETLGSGSVMIVPHDYSQEYVSHDQAGKYNVGVMTFRADDNGLGCLNWWRERCLEWCYWRHEDGKIGDQAYLNDWPERFKGVVVSNHKGINAAPWNISKYEVSLDPQGGVLIGDRPLVCYHFHACKFCIGCLTFPMMGNIPLSPTCLSAIYRPYLKRLMDIERSLKESGFEVSIPRTGIPWRYILGRILDFEVPRHFMWIS